VTVEIEINKALSENDPDCVLLIAAMGERLSDQERDVFQRLTGRAQEPLQRIEELWAVIGRRGGKTRAMSVLAAYLAALCSYDDCLAPGEVGRVVFLAQNVVTAKIAFSYAAAVFDEAATMRDMVVNRTADTLSLANRVDLSVRAASFRGLRGTTSVAVIADEAAVWYSDENGANTDSEILNVVRPSLLTTSGPLIVISSAYAKRGEVFRAYREHYGPNGDPLILVAHGTSRDFNPTLSQAAIDRAIAADPEKNSAEYLSQFRGDLESFISREAVEACVSRGCHERAPLDDVVYQAFIDPSGGSSDSMTLAIAHKERGTSERPQDIAIIDCVREVRAPFNPEASSGK
jgi:hypothetical protein